MEHRSQMVIADLTRAVAEADAKQFGSQYRAHTVDIADEARNELGRSTADPACHRKGDSRAVKSGRLKQTVGRRDISLDNQIVRCGISILFRDAEA